MSIVPFLLVRHMQHEQKKRNEASSEEWLRRDAAQREAITRIAMSPMNFLPANMAVHCDIMTFIGEACVGGMDAGLPPLVE